MTVCDRGEGGSKINHQKKRDILYGRPHRCFIRFWGFSTHLAGGGGQKS